jgi:uncharacterized membrane protein YqhA
MAEPREGSEPSPTGGSEEGATAPEAVAARKARARPEAGFERLLGLSRIVVVVPVIILLLSAFTSFAYGTSVFVRSVAGIADDPSLTSHNIGFLLLLTDLFLVGATLMIAAFGFYELFITGVDDGRPRLPLPSWLRMDDLSDLKARVISMVILVVAVTFADVAVEAEAGPAILYLGAAVALVIAALTGFLRFGS